MTTTTNRLEQLKMPLLCYDIAFKAIFTDEVNILAKMVSDITGIDYEILKDNVILETNELPISTQNEKAKRCDFILRINKNNIINLEINKNNIINLEINSNYYPGLLVKNLSYLCHIFSKTTKQGEVYDENTLVMQINLNCYEENNDKSLTKYRLQEVDSHKLYTKNISIFNLNIVKCHELYYNLDNKEDIPNYIRWGTLIYNRDLKKIPNIVKDIMTDKERDRIMDKIDKLTKDDLFYSKEEALEWARWEENSKMDYALNKGIEQKTIDIIKNMFENGSTLEFISKVTGKTISEIKKIIKEQ